MICPPPNSHKEGRGDTVPRTIPRCPICKQRITARVDDPSTAQTAKRFLQLMHATDPEAYHDVCRRHPVRRNVLSEIASREVLTDFYDPYDGEGMTAHDRANVRAHGDSVMLQINRQVHREWLSQQFRS